MNDDTAELYASMDEVPATSPELPIDTQAIVEWRKEARKTFQCGAPQTLKAVDPYSTADQPPPPTPVRKRTLDDMRRMSEEIKRNRERSGLQVVAAQEAPLTAPGPSSKLRVLFLGSIATFRRLISRISG